MEKFHIEGNLSPEDRGMLQQLYEALLCASVEGVVTIAYSGGLDSRFLSFCAKMMHFDVVLLHVAGNHIAEEETRAAKEYAADMGLECRLVDVALPTPEVLAQAQKERCYVCKRAIFSQLKEWVPQGKLCDGTNASDALVYRPGARALQELGIYSPLATARIAKSDIRRIAGALGMACPEQAARPCLLTRFPYGVKPTAEKLKTIALVESWVDSGIAVKGVRCRLRYPDGNTPELHLEESSLPSPYDAFLSDLQTDLQSRFGDQFSGLKIKVMETLSGYFDRL